MRFTQVRLDDPVIPRKRQPYPSALQPTPPINQIPTVAPRLARIIREPDEDEFVLRRKYPLALFPTSPPQTITGVAGLAITFTFGNGSLGFGITGRYGLGIQFTFGNGALLIRQPFNLFINGVDQTGLLLYNTLKITDPISNSKTATFGLWDPTGNPANLPQVGQTVVMYWKKQRIFGGTIEQPVQGAFMANQGSILGPGVIQGAGGGVTAVHWDNILDRRYVGEYYDAFNGGSLAIIASDIVKNLLSADGFTFQLIGGDISLAPQTFNWVTIRQAFNQLSSLTGYDFAVDDFKVITFFPKGTGRGVAPFNIADNDGHVQAESMTIKYMRDKYRNKQGVRSPSLGSFLWTDTFSAAIPGPFPSSPQPPDGTRIAFFTRYAINATPIVKVNGNPQVVKALTDLGGNISQPGYDFYWIPPQGGFQGGNVVQQNPTHVPLKVTDVLTVSYSIPLAPIVWVQDNTQIAARAAIEGNSGIYEDVQDAPNLTDPQAILAYAQSLLARYGSAGIPFQVDYITQTDGLASGQVQTITQATPPVSVAAGTISQVVWNFVDDQFFFYTVSVLSGEYLGDWTQFFAALANRGNIVQPSNRQTYTWVLAPSVPGLTNPGIQNTGIVPGSGSFYVRSAVEIMQSLTVRFDTPATQAQMEIEVLVNGNGTGRVPCVANGNGPFTLFYSTFASPVRLFAGDILQIIAWDVTNTNNPKDGTATLITTVSVD